MANSQSITGPSPDYVRSSKERPTVRPTRRGALGLLGAVAATSATGAATAATTSAPFSPLEVLWAEYQIKQREVQASYDALNAAIEKAREETPAYPASLYRKYRRPAENGAAEFVNEPLYREDLETELERWRLFGNRERIGRTELKLRLLDHWEKKLEACQEEHRVPELDASATELEEQRDALRDRIHETPAASARDAMIKLSAAHDRWCIDQAGDSYAFEVEPKFILRIIDDLRRATEKSAA